MSNPEVIRPGDQVEDDRAYSGFLPSRDYLGTPLPNYLRGSIGLRDRQRLARRPTMNTGRSLLPSPPRNLYQELSQSLEEESMQSSPDQVQQSPTFGRMTPPLMERDSNLALNRSSEIARLNGSLFGPPPSPEISTRSRPTFVLQVTAPYVQLELIINLLMESNGEQLCFGAQLELANHAGPGMKREWTLTAKIPEQSFGVVTKVRRMLYVMNFVAVSTLPIYSGGWIDIRYVLKSKEVPDR